MADRYQRQRTLLGDSGQELLSTKKVLVLGCGGLGGHLIEHMVRMGVGTVTAVDGDVFDESNLNRQLLSSQTLLGHSKAHAAAERAQAVNPAVRVIPVEAFFTAENADALVTGQDLVLDALDNIPARLLMEEVCARHNVPIVHGAIEGWLAQVSTVLPGSGILQQLYGSADGKSRSSKASISFTPAYCAAVQAAEALKLLLDRPSELAGKLLLVNLERMTRDIISL